VAGRGAHLVGGDVHDRGRPRARVAQVIAVILTLAVLGAAVVVALLGLFCLAFFWHDNQGGEW
jgi:hypothetical protein